MNLRTTYGAPKPRRFSGCGAGVPEKDRGAEDENRERDEGKSFVHRRSRSEGLYSSAPARFSGGRVKNIYGGGRTTPLATPLATHTPSLVDPEPKIRDRDLVKLDGNRWFDRSFVQKKQHKLTPPCRRERRRSAPSRSLPRPVAWCRATVATGLQRAC